METDKMKVLVIEDAVAQSLYLEEILRDRGFEVQIVNSLEEWRRRKDEFQPDVLVLDIIMPVTRADIEPTTGGFLAGVLLHKELTDHFSKPKKRMPAVIVLTAIGGARPELRGEAESYFNGLREHEKVNWIDKPPDVDELVNHINELGTQYRANK